MTRAAFDVQKGAADWQLE